MGYQPEVGSSHARADIFIPMTSYQDLIDKALPRREEETKGLMATRGYLGKASSTACAAS